MTELLPCWKCGSPAHMLPTIDARVMIACPESGLGAEHGAWVIEDTEEEAIAAWNTRADYHEYERAAIEAWENIKAWNTRAERTCHGNGYEEDGDFMCSGCGFVTHTDVLFNYCPNCGARVITDNEPVEVWRQASADDVTCYEEEQ